MSVVMSNRSMIKDEQAILLGQCLRFLTLKTLDLGGAYGARGAGRGVGRSGSGRDGEGSGKGEGGTGRAGRIASGDGRGTGGH